MRVLVAALLVATPSAARAAEIRSFDTCPGLGAPAEPKHPIERETVLSQDPSSWAGPPSGRCGPIRYWVELDHVRRLSGEVVIDVRVVLHAEPPYLVLGLGWPRVLHLEDEQGERLTAPDPGGPMRYKVEDTAGTLDTRLSIPLEPRGLLRRRPSPRQLRRMRATLPAVVVSGFSPLVSFDPYGVGVTVTRGDMVFTVEGGAVSWPHHHGTLRAKATDAATADLWGAFGGIPFTLEDATGARVLQRWLMPVPMGTGLRGDLAAVATPEQKPPLRLVVNEPAHARIELPLEWDRVAVPPLRVEQRPVPPAAR